MMRVLFIDENIGGHTTMHVHLREALRRGHPDVAASFVEVPKPALLRRAAGAPLPLLGRLDLDWQPIRAELALSAWVERRLRRLVGEVDAVHAYTQNTVLLSAGTLRRVPCVVGLDSTNTLAAYRLPHRAATRWTPYTLGPSVRFERRVFRAADAIVAKTDWAARSVREHYGVHDERLRVIRPGIIPPDAHPAAAPGTGCRDLPCLVFVGVSLERKGGNQLLRLHQQYLADRCRLVLVTQDRVPPGRNLTVLHDIKQGDGRLWDVLRSSAVFAFPSSIDVFSVSVLEAMAAGLPVVACPTAGVPELVADGRTGVLVPPGDDRALAAALCDLLDDSEKRAAMGAAGRARLLEQFDARREAAETVELLSEVIAEHRVRPPRRAAAIRRDHGRRARR